MIAWFFLIDYESMTLTEFKPRLERPPSSVVSPVAVAASTLSIDLMPPREWLTEMLFVARAFEVLYSV